MKWATTILCVLALHSAVCARAQDNIHPRALEDLKAFLVKFEEGDMLFSKKSYVESSTALATAHSLYQRAYRRDSSAGGYGFKLKPVTLPALRFYGYGLGENASLSLNSKDEIEGSGAGLNTALTEMWQDACVLGNMAKGPMSGAFSDPPIVDMTEEQHNRIASYLYGPVSSIELPVRDDEWRKVVFLSRRALLVIEHLLKTYPKWQTATLGWSRNNNKLQHTGNEALADIKAKLAEGEPEFAKLVADFKNAAPRRFASTLQYIIDDLNKAISGVKVDGWLDWSLARDIYIAKDYIAGKRKQLVPLYAEEGKTMPGDALKPLEVKVAELKNAIEKNASRWRFPTGKPRNPSIESRASSTIKQRLPGATIIKTALDGTVWNIAKNDLGIPRYRSRGVLVLARVPGQKLPWLIFGSFNQTYSGGGTYNSSGEFSLNFGTVRMQSGN